MSDWRNTKEEPKRISFYTSEEWQKLRNLTIPADDEYIERGNSFCWWGV